MIDPNNFLPSKAFLTKGVGRHREKLTSFEEALREAGVAHVNLVRVSSIWPPHCELVSREEGVTMLRPGQITFAVVAEAQTSEPSRLATAAIGLAVPADPSHHGYISEHHAFGQRQQPADHLTRVRRLVDEQGCGNPLVADGDDAYSRFFQNFYSINPESS